MAQAKSKAKSKTNSLSAQTGAAKLSSDQSKEERAYATGIQPLVWGRPLMEYNKTIYEKELFIENDFKRYTIGSTTDGLKKKADGSVDIYIQKDNPGKDKQSNRLPAPAGSFNLTMRMYGAATSVLDGSYKLPGIKKVN